MTTRTDTPRGHTRVDSAATLLSVPNRADLSERIRFAGGEMNGVEVACTPAMAELLPDMNLSVTPAGRPYRTRVAGGVSRLTFEGPA